MAVAKPSRIILLLALFFITAMSGSARGVQHPDPQVLALVVEVTPTTATVLSSKKVKGSLSTQASVAARNAATRPQDLHLEFEVNSTGPRYIGDTIIAFRPIVEDVKKRPAAVDKRVVIVAVPVGPAGTVTFYKLDLTRPRPGGGFERVKIGENRVQDFR